MVTEDQIDIYAVELAKQAGNPMGAAMIATKGDLGIALELITVTRDDPGFITRQRDLIEGTGAQTFLPTKELVVHEIITIARTTGTTNADLALRAYRLAAEMSGWIEKGGSNINIQTNNITKRVMIVENHGTPEEWEKKAIAQQSKLIEAAYADVTLDPVDDN